PDYERGGAAFRASSRRRFGTDLHHGRGERRRRRPAAAPPFDPWTSEPRVVALGSYVGSAPKRPAVPKAPGSREMRRPLNLLAYAFLPRLLTAQGLPTGAIQGTVAAADRSPIPGALVRITNTL